jgi:hypothetical protein
VCHISYSFERAEVNESLEIGLKETACVCVCVLGGGGGNCDYLQV